MFAILGKRTNPASENGHGDGQTQDRVIGLFVENLVEEVPGCQAVDRLRLQEESGEAAERLSRPNDAGTGRYSPALLAQSHLEGKRLVFLEQRQVGNLLDLAGLHVQVDVLAQLVDHDAMALKRLGHAGQGGGVEVAEGPGEGERRFRGPHVQCFVVLRLAGVAEFAVLLRLDEAQDFLRPTQGGGLKAHRDGRRGLASLDGTFPRLG